MFEWGTAIVQVLFIGMIFLLLYSLFKFVKSIVQHVSNTRSTLKRIEEKPDTLIQMKHL